MFIGKAFDDMTLDELNEKEDDIDEEEERIFEAYRWGMVIKMKKKWLN